MKAEIIAIGTELLLGQVVNSNAAYISRGLAELGIDVYYHTVVGDNPTRLTEAIKVAEGRADLLIFSGGLGPTKDDLTKHVIADHLEVGLVEDQEALNMIKSFYDNANQLMPQGNHKQALMFEGSQVLANENGMAPGIFYQNNHHIYAMVPGVPNEMKRMVNKELFPKLKNIVLEDEIIVSRTLRFFGLTESQLAQDIDDLIESQSNPTLAVYVDNQELTTRLTAKATDQEQAKKMLDQLEEEIQKILGPYFFGYGKKRLVERLVDYLKDNQLSVAINEEVTGGYISNAIFQEFNENSPLLKGGIIFKDEETVNQLLDIDLTKLNHKQAIKVITQTTHAQLDSKLTLTVTGSKRDYLGESKVPGQVELGLLYKGRYYHHTLDYSHRKNRTMNLILLDVIHYLRQVVMGQQL